MVNYPKSLPLDAVSIIVGATGGFAPDGEHGDKACVAQAVWNILGFGLGQWLPHDHPELKAKGAKPVAVPSGEKAQLKALAKSLEPLTVKSAAKGDAGASAVPWGQIIALALVLLEKWLKK